jgi:hypothetical protein
MGLEEGRTGGCRLVAFGSPGSKELGLVVGRSVEQERELERGGRLLPFLTETVTKSASFRGLALVS